jgi:hypothetical protein
MKIFKIFLLVFMLVPINSCMDRKFDEIKAIPKIGSEQSYTIFDTQRLGFHFNHQKGHNSVPIDVPTDIGMLILDSKYQSVDYFYFKKFNKWFKNLVFENGVMAIGQNEIIDCDNFAMLYKSLFSIGAYASNNSQEFAVASVIVMQENPFGGIPSGGLHMLNLVFTTRAWYIFEPQTGEYIELENYPNQKHIKFIIL